MNADYPDWGFDPESPFGFEIMSRSDWRKVFTDRPGRLFDEYGKEVPEPLAWLDALIPPDDEQTAKELSMYGPSSIDLTWHREREHSDPEGFRFSAYEFS